MSDRYIRLLERVHREFHAAQNALAYVEQKWHQKSIFLDMPETELPEIMRAANQQENIYFLRLFATFEGILKEHLAQHHPNVNVAEEARAVWLIDRVSQRQTPKVTAVLKTQVHEIRRYRNHLTHLNTNPLFPIPFTIALARLNKFVDKLPEPRN